MKTISSLPSTSFWSLISYKGKMRVLNSPSRVIEIRRDSAKDLVSGEQYCRKGSDLLEELLSIPITDFESDQRVLFHAFYELGHIWMGTSNLESDTLLGYWIEFSEEMDFVFSEKLKTPEIHWNKPTFESYKEAFEVGLEHLYQGDCYQFNLTMPINGSFKNLDLEAFAYSYMNSEKLRGEYASLTVVGDKAFYSNSPECLADLKKSEQDLFLVSRPIKGTVSTEKLTKEEAWNQLSNSKKDESELFMITDLLRNDMNKIGNSWVEVCSNKSPLFVNQLVHSFSELSVKLDEGVLLKDIFKSIFPGGSITGVPKKRVMEILAKIENQERGFYCGSSLLFGMGDFKTSINIRSGVINLPKKEICYHSGGGITVKSNPDQEYQELLDKFSSFVRPVNE